jgi:hypothetical protein
MTSKILQCLLFIAADGNAPIGKSDATELVRALSILLGYAVTSASMSF